MFTSVVRLLDMNRKLFAGLLFAIPFTISAHAAAIAPVSVSVSTEASCASGAWEVTWTAAVTTDQYTLEGFSSGAGSWHGSQGASSVTDSYPLDQASATMAVSIYVDGTVVAMGGASVDQPVSCDAVVAVAPAAAIPVGGATVPAPVTLPVTPPAVIIPGVNDGTQAPPPTWVRPLAEINAETQVAMNKLAAAQRGPVVVSDPVVVAPSASTPVPPAVIESFPPSFVGWPAVVISPPW